MLRSSWRGSATPPYSGFHKSKITEADRYALTRREAPLKPMNGALPPSSAPRFMTSLVPWTIRAPEH